jgi:hypothetical protein
MAVPGPIRPEVKTQIVFVGSAKDELLTMVVDQKAATVEKFPTSGLFELTRGRRADLGERRERALPGARQGD